MPPPPRGMTLKMSGFRLGQTAIDDPGLLRSFDGQALKC